MQTAQMWEPVKHVLPARFAKAVEEENLTRGFEEIRLRVGRAVEVSTGRASCFLSPEAGDACFTAQDAAETLERLSRHSVYAYEDEIRQGFITLPGGHRVGLCGRTSVTGGRVETIRNVSSFNIRAAKDLVGISRPLHAYLFDDAWLNTLIIGPPASGKTSLLRDLARSASVGMNQPYALPHKVGIVDERSEIAASVHGVPSFQFGERVDVLDRCPKAEGMMMMIRSMSPEVLVVDEIGSEADAKAVTEALQAGIRVFSSAHGASLQDARNRLMLESLFSRGAFERYVVLSNTRGKRQAVVQTSGVTS
ncbi:stage III sporulation protein AA [Salsuginibacillus halophilus]|uniref:Stage III sporulation protein AA n=1 Tax=Salsuginibacillus halophilus TaxID=517424 RepID=A0A2P8HAD2_9BACI|nr:stage III sporulation protein AA [Salsuginibacillus halophilus]PSL43186.1 stage III sporulation protein AA [Salsuginibacillus halophilus]